MKVAANRSAVLALVVALAGAVAQGRLPQASLSAQRSMVVINEVQYDPTPSGNESAYEWLELLNAGPGPVTMSGWQIGDSQSAEPLPDLVLASGDIVVVAAGDGFGELFPGYDGRAVRLDGRIGNGLGNSGDQVRLLDASGALADGMSYGDDAGLLAPSVPRAEAGHSLERYPAGADTDSAADWIDQEAPTPGQAAQGAIAPTSSPAPAPTRVSGAGVVINEYLPAPRDVDWDGDGAASALDEWVELHNAADVALDLRGWQLDDAADGGSSPHVLADGTVIQSRGYLLLFRRVTGLVLNNDRDSVRLLDPGGVVADEAKYARTAPDAAYARQPDGIGVWTDSLPPSPGGPNGGTPNTPNPPRPTPPPSATPGAGGGTAAAPTPSSTASPRASAVTATARPPRGTATPTDPPGEGELFLPFLVTEVLYDALAPGTDSRFEWVELYNRTDRPARVGGWSIGDGATWDVLPDANVPPRGYLVVVASAETASELRSLGAQVVLIADGRIGNGLSNRGDQVRVRGPTGRVADAVSYGADLSAFDPAVPPAPPGASIERLPSHIDTDAAEDWWLQPRPSPGREGSRHEGPPAVVLNEVLPAPHGVDWDASGRADYTDEWIEIRNLADYPVDLGDWRLTVGDPERWTHELPRGWMVAPNGRRLLLRAESGLSLGNDADALRLVRSDGVVADRVRWTAGPGYDRSICRLPDGVGGWTADCAVTPAEANRARESEASTIPTAPPPDDRDMTAPPADYRDRALAEVRALPAGATVAVRGRVTVPAGVLGPRVMYVGDESGGLRLYLDVPDGALPRIAGGLGTAARGRLGDYHGERQLVLDAPSEVWIDERLTAAAVAPVAVRTGDLGEGVEGRLVTVRGRATRAAGANVWLDDGSGECRVMVDRQSGFRRPWVRLGASVAVTGVASQYAARPPWEGGYRIVPRSPDDFDRAGIAARATNRDSRGRRTPSEADEPGPLMWPERGRAGARSGHARSAGPALWL